MSATAVVTPIRARAMKLSGDAGGILSPAQVCDVVPGMTIRKLQRFRDEGRGPKYSKLGRTIVYREHDVRAWVDRNVVPTREQP